jgi:hypothetical protein
MRELSSIHKVSQQHWMNSRDHAYNLLNDMQYHAVTVEYKCEMLSFVFLNGRPPARVLNVQQRDRVIADA